MNAMIIDPDTIHIDVVREMIDVGFDPETSRATQFQQQIAGAISATLHARTFDGQPVRLTLTEDEYNRIRAQGDHTAQRIITGAPADRVTLG